MKILMAEFEESLRHDDIARTLLGDRKQYIDQTFSDQSDVNSRLEIIEFALSRLGQGLYLDSCAEGVASIVKAGGKEKKRLLKLTEGFISGVLDAGYPAQTVYHLLNVAFLDNKRRKFSAAEMLDKFFSYFDLATHPYRVHFGVSDVNNTKEGMFGAIDAKYLSASSADVADFMDSLPASTKRFFGGVPIDGLLEIGHIDALDPQSARQIAERRVRLLDDLLRFSGHRTQFKLNNPALVSRIDKEVQYVHSNRPRPAVLRMPHESDDGTDDLSDIAGMFRKTKSSSMQRFLRAVELHGTALSTPEEESQLLNLWIAFETLFVTGSNGSKVKEVLDSVTSYVGSCWIGYELQELWAEVASNHDSQWQGAISESDGIKRYPENVGFFAAVALPKFEVEMTKFLGTLDENPLLRCKIVDCINWAQNPAKISNHLDEISARIAADINRVYRYRNQLVHIGHTMGDLGAVVQCAHHYLDVVLNLLTLILGKPGGPRTIEQANIEVRIKGASQRKLLAKGIADKKDCEDNSFLSFLMGRAPLA
ncbi:HEPN domain-containing protein [Paraburkholderia strydomiana]|uniref:hypothetical protein n=1 Tax=Paraburkholderia strydomiana TaxID=1245417 RepID=UPI0038BAAA05